jgi:hypothetical protein
VPCEVTNRVVEYQRKRELNACAKMFSITTRNYDFIVIGVKGLNPSKLPSQWKLWRDFQWLAYVNSIWYRMISWGYLQFSTRRFRFFVSWKVSHNKHDPPRIHNPLDISNINWFKIFFNYRPAVPSQSSTAVNYFQTGSRHNKNMRSDRLCAFLLSFSSWAQSEEFRKSFSREF